jgi:hypothetical protein
MCSAGKVSATGRSEFVERTCMKRYATVFCALLSLASLTGCSLIAGGKVVKGPADMSKLRRIDPNDPNSIFSMKIVETPKGKRAVLTAKGSVIDMEEDPYRVKYHFPPLPGIQFHGMLAGSSHKYDVRIDTGSPYPILVNDLHVRKNNLPVYSIPGTNEGLCHLPDLQIGKLTIRSAAAVYRWEHFVMLLFGLPMNDDDILLGVPLLRKFKYVAFDDANKEVEFSTARSFLPDDRSAWSRYPFVDPNASEGQERICLELPIQDRSMTLVFDTGYRGTLLVGEKAWQQVEERLPGVKSDGKPLYGPLMGGKLSSRSLVVGKLRVGDEVVKNATVNVMPDDTPLLKSFKKAQGLLGMDCFKGTTIVLDFEQKVLWVKNRAEPPVARR